jgi:hypothetical protein
MDELPYVFENGVMQQMTQAQYDAHMELMNNISLPIPSVISMRQFRLALIDVDKISHVHDAIDAVTDPVVRSKIQVEWEYNTIVERHASWVIHILENLEMSEPHMDSLFVQAAQL